MEENNVHTGMPDAGGDFDGHPTQAHADHAAIMKAHGIISSPERMNAVHELHAKSGGLMSYLKKKQADFATKESEHNIGTAPAHEETASNDKDQNMEPNPVMAAGKKQSAQMG